MANNKITSLLKERKERNISNCLSYDKKIKLDISLDNTKFFIKAVKEISKKYFFAKTMETNDQKLIDEIDKEFQFFKIDIEEITDKNILDTIGRAQLRYTSGTKTPNNIIEYVSKLVPIKCTISDKFNTSFSFYSVLRGRIGDKTSKYLFRCNNKKIKILDFFTAISEIYIINEVINYNKSNREIVIDVINSLNNKVKYYRSFITYLNEYFITGEKNTISNLCSLKTSYSITKEGSAYMSTFAKEVLGAIFKEIVIDNKDIIIQEKQIANMNSDYARAFQKKKNISNKTLKAMEKSIFNIYFKNVEFDNDVDLMKIKQVENEFQDTLEFLNPNESILKFMKEVSLRFRYLGKHKAVGLYFPLQKCLCVDLRDPSAFLHEFMHMVDYQGYKFDSLKLSSKYNFRKIKNKYIEILDKTIYDLPSDDSFKKIYYGKTKYNKDYYTNSAEVFARCGEIYLNNILKVDNSLIKSLDKTNIIYPLDEQLILLIKEYYSSLFDIRDKIEKVSAKAKNINNKVEFIISEEGQLKLNF
ncbi:hypothetical protein EXM63_02110 [Clostridium botulinum]|uniref:Large polyvalent protein-associated domain-containing protein n=1 Tax=Clostridium botulinum TaxID=1491 RepID=A0A6M0SXU4_CLOBO|nr:hypothetical protein [Clostridium botulinum]NFI74410.1 hypothetical protein [Clostridium sporogenes]NFP62318.1 hypothetical protein [Clostridium sporogenes]NFU95530.1 hypothetical protein [Clostridium sporogenes]NFV67863.1 hypothetical protein [Clostridium botulinum]